MIDIVIGTYNRLPYLLNTLGMLSVRTHTPYRLHIIDDGSTDGNTDYLFENWKYNHNQLISCLLLRSESRGVAANLIAAKGITQSDIVVFTDDDVLCPDVEPDWLARGLAALEADESLGALGLNDPSSNINERRHIIEQAGPVTYCKRLGGQFLFIRRQFLLNCPEERLYATASPVKELCHYIQSCHARVGYLTNTYCWHFGAISARTGADVSDLLLEPGDKRTLEPPEEYRY